MIGYTSQNATGTLTFTPNPNAHGAATITVTVRDAGETDSSVTATMRSTRQFTITVTPVRTHYREPRHVQHPRPRPTRHFGSGVLANDTDPDGDRTRHHWFQGPSTRHPAPLSGRIVHLHAHPRFRRNRHIHLRRSIRRETSAPATVTINVALSNRAPIATADTFTTTEDAPQVAPSSATTRTRTATRLQPRPAG